MVIDYITNSLTGDVKNLNRKNGYLPTGRRQSTATILRMNSNTQDIEPSSLARINYNIDDDQ
jgi:hypothetical protein